MQDIPGEKLSKSASNYFDRIRKSVEKNKKRISDPFDKSLTDMRSKPKIPSEPYLRAISNSQSKINTKIQSNPNNPNMQLIEETKSPFEKEFEQKFFPDTSISKNRNLLDMNFGQRIRIKDVLNKSNEFNKKLKNDKLEVKHTSMDEIDKLSATSDDKSGFKWHSVHSLLDYFEKIDELESFTYSRSKNCNLDITVNKGTNKKISLLLLDEG
jgi:hypothetical protein